MAAARETGKRFGGTNFYCQDKQEISAPLLIPSSSPEIHRSPSCPTHPANINMLRVVVVNKEVNRSFPFLTHLVHLFNDVVQVVLSETGVNLSQDLLQHIVGDETLALLVVDPEQ